ncbi:MAG: hypothetical protein ABS36_10445 [Acidobacteria bacterium SCN 69-37]|nr:MAG: hypothetical protein ABS36_10445 [Acidobacteria bacterium SCN 69-37]
MLGVVRVAPVAPCPSFDQHQHEHHRQQAEGNLRRARMAQALAATIVIGSYVLAERIVLTSIRPMARNASS